MAPESMILVSNCIKKCSKRINEEKITEEDREREKRAALIGFRALLKNRKSWWILPMFFEKGVE